METEILQPLSTEEFKWNMLIRAMRHNRCVLFMGPFLPLYSRGEQKVDFYRLASQHLANEMKANGFEFDHTQTQNLNYIAQKFVVFNKNYRPSLDDEISQLYLEETRKLTKANKDTIPPLYRTILQLPWHTIVNMQPDNYFSKSLKPDQVFNFYSFRGRTMELNMSDDKLLVFNLFGTIVRDGGINKVDSLVLTEEDQVEFVRNLVRGDPRIPDSILSRFDNDKIYIFLDCNLENWYFRLLMEILKIHKDSHAFSPASSILHLTSPTIEFYRKRYGFVFINNNSEEFINKFKEEYENEYSQKEQPPKKIFIAYHDSSEELVKSLMEQFVPWVEQQKLSVWHKENILPGDDPLKVEIEQFKEADIVLLLINARFLGELEKYVSMRQSDELGNNKKYFAILESACAWDKSQLKDFNMEAILPSDFVPIKLQQKQDPDKIIYEVVKSITDAIWE